MQVLLPLLCTIQHPDHPDEGMAGMMMEAAAFALVSARHWLVPDHKRSLQPHAGVSMRQIREEKRREKMDSKKTARDQL